MDELNLLLYVLAILVFAFAGMVALGHGIWVLAARVLRALSGGKEPPAMSQDAVPSRCIVCDSEWKWGGEFCGVCGASKPSSIVLQVLMDLSVTERQIERFHRSGKLDAEIYDKVTSQIQLERARLKTRHVAPAASSQQQAPPQATNLETPAAPSSVTIETPDLSPAVPPSAVTGLLTATEEAIVIEPVPSFLPSEQQRIAEEATQRAYHREEFTPPRPPRKPFTEVLNSFMEESNIRWGEIIGGLLIIGCSTALVVSLWAQISEIPVLKFLIFTTVTAILFGVGLYTEHRWKLPTTSRGILTIATLLVPLNFLAIAAVSASTASGSLVIVSELLAPAIFLCLVYFAGKVITPGCAHLLSAGVLGSSVGQLLVRHFAAPDSNPAILILLGAFPVACYVITVGLALRLVLADREIDESETTTVFTILGTMSFAALLPFGLLLYKSGPFGLTMMYLAPLVTLWGLPMLATGTVMWRRIRNRSLVASRTTGTALGLLGVGIVIAGMLLAWPNPASIVPAALLNFAIFTVLAVALELPVAHLIATACFGLAFVVVFHVSSGHIQWQNLRVMSLLDISLSVSSGQALAGPFILFLVAAEWLVRRKRLQDSFYYLVAACSIAILSLIVATIFGVWSIEPHAIWILYGLYSLGAFWIAWRKGLTQFTWIGSTLLLFAFAQNFAQLTSLSFPWQTAFLVHATVCAMAAILSSNDQKYGILSRPLNFAALISSLLAMVCLFQANPWQVTSMQAERVFWIAAIWLLLLWLNRRSTLFTAFQIALTSAFVLTVKAALQQYEWYTYLPHAFLHPTGLQIQGTALALLSLLWISVRLFVRRFVPSEAAEDSAAEVPANTWQTAAWKLLNTKYSVDQIVCWAIMIGFLLLAFYGAFSGVTQELAALGSNYAGWNLAGFPHWEALGLGSWILLGLLTITMLANLWERRRGIYLLGAIATLTGILPLIAGLFETQIAVASAWRWLSALFLLCGSAALWYREEIAQQLKTIGWPQLHPDTDREAFPGQLRTLLISLTVVPLLLLTIYPALRAIYYLPVQGAVSGFFSLFDDAFSYGVPLVLVALVLIGYAIRERLPEFGFYAGLLLNGVVTMTYLLSVVAVNGSMDRLVLIRTIQLNAIAFAVYALPWLSKLGRWQPSLDATRSRLSDDLLKLQIGLAVVLNILVITPVIVRLVLSPDQAVAVTIASGSIFGWVAFLITLVGAAWVGRSRGKKLSATALAAVLIGLSCLIAFSFTNASGWTGLHVLTINITLTAGLMLASAGLTSLSIDQNGGLQTVLDWCRATFNLAGDWQVTCRKYAAILGGLTVFLCLRSLPDGVAHAWWSLAPMFSISVLAAVLNWQTVKRRYLYAAGILFNLTLSIWWIVYFGERFPNFTTFLEVNIIGGCLASILWLWLELRARHLHGKEAIVNTSLSFHHLMAILSLVVLAAMVFASFAFESEVHALVASPGLAWGALASVVALMTACIWDQHARYAVAGLYLLGLIAGAMAIQSLGLPSTRLAWSATMLLAVYTLVTSLLWRSRRTVVAFAKKLGMPERVAPDVTELPWLSAFNILAVVTIVSIAYWIDLRFVSFELRSTAALAVVAQAVTLGLLAEGTSPDKWRRGAIASFVAGVVLLGWAWLTPGISATWLNRSVILMVETFALTAIYGLFLDKVRSSQPEWTNSVRSCVPWILGAGVISLFFCLGTEIFYQLSFGAVRISTPSLVAIGLTLAASIVICVLFALSPNHDPLGLSEPGRMKYVYVAEMMLALLFLHIRLTMPWLFTGFLERYWPIVVMAIAYLGVVASESLRRRNLLVLAQPMERTGAFLPLLPVLGFWLAQSQVDYSALLFIVGGLYGLLSLLRRSFVFGLLAAVAGNGGLWYLLHHSADYQFLQHPQLWLIPVALSVLLAAYLNEENLTEDQLAGIRYLSLVTIYASSTADIFINGVANSPWLPLILGAFSLAGVFSGIIFRIRGLLLLGSVFLLLSIITMIWYASANLGWTWLWYVAGIVTGATIIFMFAVFEKKRSEVLRVVEGLKEWER